MTPQERQLIDDLFGRLEKLEANPREPEAEAAIVQGLRRAPHAVYALVQTVLLQDEALRRTTTRIEQLEAGQHPEKEGSFLDSLRDTLFGGGQASQGYAQGSTQGGSVPNVPPGTARPSWNTGQVLGNQGLGGDAPGRRDAFPDPRAAQGYGAPQSGGGGSSFLGTAAAAAAGMIGGSLLMNSLRGLGGGGQQQSFGNTGSPWSGGGSNDALARDAGINDIGKTQHGGVEDRRNEHAAYDDASSDYDDDDYDDDNDFDDGDFGSDPSDFA